MSAPMSVGRCSGGAATTSICVETPVTTINVSIFAAFPPAMSVSRRSPIASGFFAPTRSAALINIGGFGLPADSGATPVVVEIAAATEPLPTRKPRSDGSVVSKFDTRKRAPRDTASAASDICFHVISRLSPWNTAAGLSSAESTRLYPASRANCLNDSAPNTKTFEPGSMTSAAISMAACADVITSSA